MDNNQNINENIPTSSTKQNNPLLRFAVPVAFLALGLVLGMGITKILPQKETAQTQQPNNTYKSSPLKTADPKTLIDPTQIMQHPVFTEWLGSVEGTLVGKTNDSFTIEKGGKQLTIYTQEALTGFYGKPVAGVQQPPKITLNDIPVGTYLRGGVTITRLSFSDIADRHIFANIFSVVDNETPNNQ